MPTLFFIHDGLATAAWLFFLIVGVWGLVRAGRGLGTDGAYIGAVATGQIIFIAQGIIGGLLWLNSGSGGLVRPGIHLLYGLFAIVFLPFIYLVTLRGDDSNQAQWILAFSTLFMFGISLRSIVTAAGYA